MNKSEILNIIENNKSNFTRVIKSKDINLYNLISKIDGVCFSEKLYIYLTDKRGVCNECKCLTKFIGINDGYREFCSRKCVSKNIELKNKVKNSVFEKYGVSNISQNENIKNKKKSTFLSRYGVGSPVEMENVKLKRKLKTIEYIENNKTKLLKNLNLHRKMSFIKDCFNGNRLGNDIIPLFDINTFTTIKDTKLRFQCKKCDNIFHHHLQWGVKPECWRCNPNSKLQNEIHDYILKKGLEINPNVRNIINGELDIYIPNLKMAIECNGVYWHSCDRKDINYHLNKTIQCENLGIRLIHIFENEWKDVEFKSIIDDILNNKTDLQNYKTFDGFYIVDRRIFNKVFFDNTKYQLLEELPPSKSKFDEHECWNCGYLKYIDRKI